MAPGRKNGHSIGDHDAGQETNVRSPRILTLPTATITFPQRSSKRSVPGAIPAPNPPLDRIRFLAKVVEYGGRPASVAMTPDRLRLGAVGARAYEVPGDTKSQF